MISLWVEHRLFLNKPLDLLKILSGFEEIEILNNQLSTLNFQLPDGQNIYVSIIFPCEALWTLKIEH